MQFLLVGLVCITCPIMLITCTKASSSRPLHQVNLQHSGYLAWGEPHLQEGLALHAAAWPLGQGNILPCVLGPRVGTQTLLLAMQVSEVQHRQAVSGRPSKVEGMHLGVATSMRQLQQNPEVCQRTMEGNVVGADTAGSGVAWPAPAAHIKHWSASTESLSTWKW
jgi:hypothetical protein